MHTIIEYLSYLLEKSLSFSEEEKILIFQNALNLDPISRGNLIDVLENEQKWWDYIKNDYQKKLAEIWENYKNDLLAEYEKLKQKKKKEAKDKLKKMKILEEKEKEQVDEDLDLLLNNV